MLRRRCEEKKGVLVKELEDLKDKEEQLDTTIRNKEELVMEQEDVVNKVKEEQQDREQEDDENKVQGDTMI